jgi:hypothetical protein
VTATEFEWRLDQQEAVLERPLPAGRRLLGGAAAGLLATVPMTLLMVRLHKELPPCEGGPLPPREITEKLTEEAGFGSELSEPEMRALTLAAHFGYGAAMGALYALIAPLLRGPSPATGLVFGLGVWVDSYMGWLPFLRILPPPDRESPRRNALMVAAHVVWGVAVGALAAIFVPPVRSPVRHET